MYRSPDIIRIVNCRGRQAINLYKKSIQKFVEYPLGTRQFEDHEGHVRIKLRWVLGSEVKGTAIVSCLTEDFVMFGVETSGSDTTLLV
jgi:hypothetical protein